MRINRKLTFAILIVSLCFLLSGCKSSDYKTANEYLKNEQYEEAIALFEELGDYENSKELLAKAKLGYAVSVMNEGEFADAKTLFEDYAAEYGDSTYAVDISGYNYVCSYNILKEYLQANGDLKFDASEDNNYIEDYYYILIKDFDTCIYVGYEGEWYDTSDFIHTLEYKGYFNNFFFYLPNVTVDAPSQPSSYEWHYAESDVFKGYEPITKAEGYLTPSNWFELSLWNNDKVVVNYILEQQKLEGEESSSITAYSGRDINYFGQVLDYLNLGITLDDFGFTNLDNAIEDFAKK